MDPKNSFQNLMNNKDVNKSVFDLLVGFLLVLGLFVVLNILFPTFVSIFFNILWVILMAIVAIFLGLGILVILGMRKEVNRILDYVLEGTLTILDFVNFIRELWRRFINLLIEFLIYCAPALASIFGAILYVLLIYIYKYLGSKFDVTFLTMGITVVMVALVEILNRLRVAEVEQKWTAIFKQRFQNTFSDAFEVLLFVFFLTMDSTNLVFLPKELNVLIHADVWGYDFMKRAFTVNDHFITFTLNLIMVSVISEILRYCLKIAKISYEFYVEQVIQTSMEGSSIYTKTILIKDAIRRAFSSTKQDTIKFITFNTVLFMVFLVFPRLKLLAMATASLTALILSLFLPKKTVSTEQNDLISRILARVFRL